MAAPAPIIVAVLQIGWKQQGQQERYALKTTGLVDGIALAKQIAYGRTAFFAQDVELDWVRVSSTDQARDGIPVVLDYPLGPHPSWSAAAGAPIGDKLATMNDPKTVVQMRLNRNTGQFWQRYYRFCPDPWVVANRLPVEVTPYWKPLAAGVAPVDMTGNGAHLQICQSFWSYLIANTYAATRVDKNNYTVNSFDLVTYAQITSKKVGRRFRTSRGRLSVAGG